MGLAKIIGLVDAVANRRHWHQIFIEICHVAKDPVRGMMRVRQWKEDLEEHYGDSLVDFKFVRLTYPQYQAAFQFWYPRLAEKTCKSTKVRKIDFDAVKDEFVLTAAIARYNGLQEWLQTGMMDED